MATPQIVLQESLLGEDYQIGELVKTYQTQVTRAGMWFFGVSMFLLIGVVAALVSMIIFVDIPFFSDPFYRPSSVDIFMTAILPLLLLLGTLFGLYAQMRGHNRFITPLSRKIVVSLYTNGLVYCKGSKQQVVHWEQVHNIERGIITPWVTPLRQYQSYLEDAPTITLPRGIAQVDELGKAIEHTIIKRLLPQMQADYIANKPVVFTGLCLTRETMSKSDETLRWSEVERISFGVEMLSIKERGRKKDWLAAPMVQFRNVCVLEALLAQIREEHGFE